MLRNYIKVISRNVYRNKLYATINILGLSLGFSAFILTTIYLQFETSFENFHTQSDRIFRPTYDYHSGTGYDVHWARVPLTYINEFPDEIPEIEHLIRLQNQEPKYIRIDENKFTPNHIYITDNEIFDVFNFEFISGNPKNALSEPNSIVITTSVAKQYFGNEDALNKDIFVLGAWNKKEVRHKVTGIIKDVPSNTHLPIKMLLSFQNEEERSGWAYIYILLRTGSDIDQVIAKMPDFIQKHADKESASKISFEFQPIKQIHLHSNLAREIVPNGNYTYIKIFAVTGIFILLVALVNYINLNGALIFGRSKEVGLRKVLGASSSQLTYYLLFESITYNLIAVIIAGGIAFISFPYFKVLTGVTFIGEPWILLIGMILLALFCGLFSGIFHSISISKNDPIQSIKQSHALVSLKKNRSINLKRIMVTLQYGISILLIGSTFIARDQFKFLIEKNLGIEKEQVLAIPGVPDEVKDGFKTFKDRINNVAGVAGVTACMEVPSREIRDVGPVLIKGINTDPEKAPVMDIQLIDRDYIDLLGIELIAGKNIPKSLESENVPEFTEEYTFQDYLKEQRRAYIINETAMKDLGWNTPEEAIGQEISWSIGSYELDFGPIVGIVKDYHQETLKNTIDPTIMVYEPIWLRTFLIKVETNHIQETITSIKSSWDDWFPLYPLEYHFLDDMYETLYKSERVKLQLLYLLSGLAIVISFIGLFGLIAYSLKSRIKEIAIRKVLGANVVSLIKMISKEYLFILLIASVIAFPLSYYFIDQWLQQFAYKVDISIMNYSWSILLVGFLILLTISSQTIKTSLINPADTLRDE